MTGISATRNPKIIQLNDTDGVDDFTIKDADGFELFKIDSEGTIKTRRGIQRI